MKYVDVYTQEDMERVLRDGDRPELRGSGEFVVRDSATVHAWDSATVHAWDSATVHAGGSATVHAGGSATVHAGKFVATQKMSRLANVTGGHIIEIEPATSPGDWAEIHLAAPHEDGVLVLYKAVSDDYRSGYDFEYKPGSMPVAPDWDGGDAECGGGLHFCASPMEAMAYHSEATRFMACPVALDDLAVVPNPAYPNKIKARGCCAPIWEVDINGKRVGEGAS